MAAKKTATVILIDVSAASQSTFVRRSNGEVPFLEEAKWVISRILLRKIFSTENDEVALMLMGSSVTNCSLALTSEGYDNIHELCPLQLASFDEIEAVTRLKSSDVDYVDWLVGIAAASDFLNKSCAHRRFGKKQLVILSPFATELDYDTESVTNLIEGINLLKLTVVFVGVDPNDSLFDEGKLSLLRTAFEILETPIHLSWSEARDAFKLYEKKSKMARFTKVSLEIGENVQIPMRHMKLNIDETRFTWLSVPRSVQESKDPPSGPRTTGDNEVVAGAEIGLEKPPKLEDSDDEKPFVVRYSMDDCKSTVYGATEVLLSYSDLEALNIETGSPSLRYIASVRSSRITRAMLVGSDSYAFIPEANPRSVALFSAFADTLLKEERYALVRRVASKNGSVSIGVLIPVTDELGKSMYYVKLPFSDFIRGIPQKVYPTETHSELEEIFDKIVNSMRLTIKGRDVLFKDPNFQRKCDLVAKAALGSDVHSVTLSDDDFDQLFNPFKELQLRATPFVEELQRLYPINLPVKNKRGKPLAVEEASKSTDELPVVTTMSPSGIASSAGTDSEGFFDNAIRTMQDVYNRTEPVESSQQSTEDLQKRF